MKNKNEVYLNDFRVNNVTKITTIRVSNFGIIRELENASDKEISAATKRYASYFRENTKPIAKTKRLLRKIATK